MNTKAETVPAPDVLQAEALGTGHRRRIAYWIVSVLLAVAAVTAAYRFLHRPVASYTYTTLPASSGPLTVTVTATGQLQPLVQVEIGSEVSGTIEQVEADYNSRVRKGQVLARINPDKLAAGAAQARAARAAADARMADARAAVKVDALAVWRCTTLRAKQLCTQESLDGAQAALERAQASLDASGAEAEQAAAAQKVAETDLAKAVIRSPIDGIVLIRSVEPGQTVAASFQSPVLFTLAQDLAHMELDVDVDEADIGSVKQGEPATFSVDAYPDRSFPARLTQVRFGPKTVQGVVTYQAVLMVDNRDLALRPGMTATASITVKHVTKALLVPNASLRFQPPEQEDGESRGLVASLLPHAPHSVTARTHAPAAGSERDIWVLKDGRPEPLRISIGASDGSMTEVLKGALNEGDSVITDATAAKR